MAQHGGKREGAGRPKKADEAELIAKLSEFDDLAFEKLAKGLRDGSSYHLKLFFEYRFGKPRQQVDVTTDGERIQNNFNSLTFEQLMKLSKNDNSGTDKK